MVLGRTDADEFEGDADELAVRFGISNRNVETNQRRKVQMSAQTQGLWLFPAHDLEQVDDDFCNNTGRGPRYRQLVQSEVASGRR